MFFKRRKHDNCYAEKLSEKTGCPCEKVTVSKAAEVMQLYFRELESGRAEGYTPVLFMADEMALELIESNHTDAGGAEAMHTLFLDQEISGGKEYLFERYREMSDELDEEETDEEDFDLSDYGPMDYEPIKEFVSITEEAPNEGRLILIRVPTTEPWRVFTWLPFGGWNECPPNNEIMAVSRYWFEKYGAIPAVITSDTLEFYVRNPITYEDDANELAKEQYAFCRDIVDQGLDSVEALAGTILGSNVWYFWWD